MVTVAMLIDVSGNFDSEFGPQGTSQNQPTAEMIERLFVTDSNNIDAVLVTVDTLPGIDESNFDSAVCTPGIYQV